MNTDLLGADTKKRRNTAQKQIILDTLIRLGSHVSAGTIYRELQRTHPHIGRATVFRVLSDMAGDGSLLRRTGGGKRRPVRLLYGYRLPVLYGIV